VADSPFSVGDKVHHHNYGVGEVMDLADDGVFVRFDMGIEGEFRPVELRPAKGNNAFYAQRYGFATFDLKTCHRNNVAALKRLRERDIATRIKDTDEYLYKLSLERLVKRGGAIGTKPDPAFRARLEEWWEVNWPLECAAQDAAEAEAQRLEEAEDTWGTPSMPSGISLTATPRFARLRLAVKPTRPRPPRAASRATRTGTPRRRPGSSWPRSGPSSTSTGPSYRSPPGRFSTG
jgi:hypothetical protein